MNVSMLFLCLAALVQSALCVQVFYNTSTTEEVSSRLTCSGNTYINTSEIFIDGGCIDPQLSVSFVITDFDDDSSEYVAIKVNGVDLGFCTGPSNYSNVPSDEDRKGGTDGYHLWDNYNCFEYLSIVEITGTNPPIVAVDLQVSPYVTDNPYQDIYNLDGNVTLTCNSLVFSM